MDLMWLYTLHSGFTQAKLVYNTEIVSFKQSNKKLIWDQFFSITKMLLCPEA